MKKAKSAPQLKNYRWKGTNSVGRPVSGYILAISESEVRDKLKQQKVKIAKLIPKKLSVTRRIMERANPKDITILTRQLATMLSTGISVIQSLKLVSDNHTKAEMKSILTHVTKDIESGMPLSTAMKSASPLFDSLYIDLIATGETAGNLPQVFQRIAQYREKSERLKSKVIKAMIYPSMVVLVAILVCYIMLAFVIPEFESMFSSFGADLPVFTQKVLDFSHFVRSYGFEVAIAILLTVITIKFLRKRSHRIELFFSRFSLRIPIVGKILSKAAIAKFSRTLATSFGAGIPILSCIKTSAKTANQTHYQNALDNVYRDTAAGMPLYLAMRHADTFPEMTLQMVMIGEESGKLDDMLNKIATIYEIEIDDSVDNLGKVIEPLIIVFLSVIVGSLVFAIYLPIFNLMNVIG